MINLKHARIITVATNTVLPFVTEHKQKKVLSVSNKNGDKVAIKTHQMTKDLRLFLESSGLEISELECRNGFRGLSEIVGVAVNVSPINHTNYDGGVYIKVAEEDELDMRNTNKIIAYLRKNKIDIEKFCSYTETGKSCTLKTGT